MSRTFGILVIVACITLAACASSENRPLADATSRDTDDNRILVTVESTAAPVASLSTSGRLAYRPPSLESERGKQLRTAQRLTQEYGLQLEEDWPIPSLQVHCFVFRVTDGEQRKQVLAALEARDDIDSAQPLQFFHGRAEADIKERGDPLAGWNKDLHERLRAVHESTTGRFSTVAVIDTGVDLAHEDLHGVEFEAIDFVDGALEVPAETHGTAVVGLIAARPGNGIGIRGYAPDARLLLIRACWEADANRETAVCNTFTLAKALSLALEAGADIVNLSISGPSDPLLERLGAALIRRGLVLVAAGESERGFPAAVPGSIAAARYPLIPVAGDKSLTLLPGNRYGMRNGSSITAAKITAIAALMKQLEPELSSHALEAALSSGAAIEPRIEYLVRATKD